jgi:imidazolonepropionase-like amidohydrolase
MRDVREMHAAGVPLAAGTDIGAPLLVPGFSLHDELELLVRVAGMTPAEALRAATLTPARVLGRADSLGTVEPGRLADLVLLDADPLADIRNTRRIHAVVADGRLLDRAALDALLAEAEHAAAPAALTRQP